MHKDGNLSWSSFLALESSCNAKTHGYNAIIYAADAFSKRIQMYMDGRWGKQKKSLVYRPHPRQFSAPSVKILFFIKFFVK
jgi:hypothetical protein